MKQKRFSETQIMEILKKTKRQCKSWQELPCRVD